MIESMNFVFMSVTDIQREKQLGRMRGKGKGLKLSIIVACSLVADKNKSFFPEKRIICQEEKRTISTFYMKAY